MAKKGKKKTSRSSQDPNLGLLNVSQMLLPTEPLELWDWNRGYGRRYLSIAYQVS